MYYVNQTISRLYRVFDQDNRSAFLRLDLNENPGGLPEEFVREVLRRITPQMIAQYPETEDFKKLLAEYLHTEVSRLCLVNGSAEGIRHVIQAFTSPGGRIVGIVPSYYMFHVFSEMYERIYVEVPYDADLHMDVGKIISEMTEDTQLLILQNPNNPVGNAYSEEEFREMISAAKKKEITVLIDEAYCHFGPQTMLRYAIEDEHIFISRTFSKLFSMAGCRLGYIIGWPEGINLVQKMCTPHNINVFGLAFAGELLKKPEEIDRLLQRFREGRDYLVSWLTDNGYAFRGEWGNFLFIKPKSQSQLLVKRMREEKRTLIKSYPSVGNLGDCLRVTIGGKDHMQAFTSALEELDADPV